MPNESVTEALGKAVLMVVEGVEQAGEATWNAMHEALKEMRQRYPDDWQDLSIYDDLAEALEHYYAEGLVLSTTGDGQTYVDVPLTFETTPQPER